MTFRDEAALAGAAPIMRIFILLLSTLILSCGPMKPPPPETRQFSFNPSEYAKYEESGTGSIVGEAFLRTRGGDIKRGAGVRVYLIPKTLYAMEWLYLEQTLGRQMIPPVEPQLMKYVQSTVADSAGQFEFTNLPSGKYHVACEIFWSVPGITPGGTVYSRQTGGIAKADVIVQSGQKTKAILTQ